MHVCMSGKHASNYSHIYIGATFTYPLDSKLHSFEVYNGDGPITSLSNAPLHSLPGGEGQEGPLLKGSNTLHSKDSAWKVRNEETEL